MKVTLLQLSFCFSPIETVEGVSCQQYLLLLYQISCYLLALFIQQIGSWHAPNITELDDISWPGNMPKPPDGKPARSFLRVSL